MRLAKKIALISSLSRRQAEKAILEGRVVVNNEMMTTPVFWAKDDDVLLLDGERLDAIITPKLWSFYKPRGCLVTREDPYNRCTVFDYLKHFQRAQRYVTIGRLDYQSEGLLLLTNTPHIAHKLEKSFLKRCYYVWTQGEVHHHEMAILEKGVSIEGISYAPCKIRILKKGLLEVILQEGKNREIRRLLHSVHLKVTRLLRVSFGPFDLRKQSPDQLYEENLSKLKGFTNFL